MVLSKTGKIILWVSVALVVLGAGTTTIFLISKKKKKKKEENIRKQKQENFKKEQAEALAASYKGGGQGTSGAAQEVGDPNIVVPFIDVEGQLANPYNEIGGFYLFPRTVFGGKGYANIRTSPEVNTGWINNQLTKVDAPNMIGYILAESEDDLDPPMRWFKVKLLKPVGGKTIGYVRADTVTTAPYNKKYSSEMDRVMADLRAKYPDYRKSGSSDAKNYKAAKAVQSKRLRQLYPIPYNLYKKFGVPAPAGAPKV